MSNALPKRPLPFGADEYAARIATTRQAMAQRGIDALIVVDPSNMAWLTGYDGWSFYVHQAVILTMEGPPLWWGRTMDGPGARMTVWMADEAVHPYPDMFVQNPEAHPYKHLCGLLKEWGLESATIGVELDNYYFSAACIGQLLAHNEGASYVDATGLVNWRRIVKSPAEIRLIQRAGKIVEKTHLMIAERIEPGVRKSSLIADIYAELIDGAEDADGEYGGDYPAIAPMAPSGHEASAAHLTWDDQPFRQGEATFFEIAGCYRRYHCPQSRTFFLGDPPAAIRKAESAAVAGVEAALEAARPGAVAEEVEAAWRTTIAKYGFEKESRIGYSVGLSYPPDWGERTMSIRKGDRTELIPGMVLHLIPALWEENFGLEITETFLVTDRGAQPFCETPRKLFVS